MTPLPTVQHLKHLSDPFTTRAAAPRPSRNQRSNPNSPHLLRPAVGRERVCMHAAARLLSSRKKKKKPPFFSPVHWRQRADAGESADGMKQGFAPPEVILTGHPHPSANERKPNPPPGVVRRIQTKASEATRRGSGTRLSVSPPRRASLFPPAERTSAAVPRRRPLA